MVTRMIAKTRLSRTLYVKKKVSLEWGFFIEVFAEQLSTNILVALSSEINHPIGQLRTYPSR